MRSCSVVLPRTALLTQRISYSQHRTLQCLQTSNHCPKILLPCFNWDLSSPRRHLISLISPRKSFSQESQGPFELFPSRAFRFSRMCRSMSERRTSSSFSSLPASIPESALANCERNGGEKLRIAVLLSGGVDSSVALRLLQAAGHTCTGFYLKIWFQEDFKNFWGECPWEEDLGFVEEVCRQTGVPLRVVHLSSAYWSRVVSHCVEEIRRGNTPNPDVLCNSRVKFGAFFDEIDFSEFDRVASGHYARVDRQLATMSANPGEGGGREDDKAKVKLLLSKDLWKDQTYFLSHLTQQQLARVMFPLGGLLKSEVREIAEALNLPNCRRKDSQGICFLGKVKFSEFVAQHLGERKGRILEAESGTFLGTHNGFWFHTIGQRSGLKLSGGPWYVVAKDLKNNVVFASKDYYSSEKSRRIFRVGNFVWISGEAPKPPFSLKCKVRHGPKFYDCSFEFETCRPSSCPSNEEQLESLSSAVVTLLEDDQGLASGQFAAFYQDEVCIGSGVILEAMDVGGGSSVPSEEAKKVAEQLWVEEGPKIGRKKKRREERRRALGLAEDGFEVSEDGKEVPIVNNEVTSFPGLESLKLELQLNSEEKSEVGATSQ